MQYLYEMYELANGVFLTVVFSFAISNLVLEKIVMIKEKRFNAKESALDIITHLAIILCVFLVRIGFEAIGYSMFSEVIMFAVIGHYIYAIANNFKALGFYKIYEVIKTIRDFK